MELILNTKTFGDIKCKIMSKQIPSPGTITDRYITSIVPAQDLTDKNNWPLELSIYKEDKLMYGQPDLIGFIERAKEHIAKKGI